MGAPRPWVVRAAAALTVAALGLSGCGGEQPPAPLGAAPVAATTAAAPPAEPATDETPDAESTTTAPSTATPTARRTSTSPKPATKKPTDTSKPSKKPSKKPTRKPVPDKPTVAKPQAKPGCTEKFVGTAVSRAQVKQALTDAAGRSYWPVSAPELTVPLALVKAVAWQESTWRSNVHACDGGVGLMQIMPGTAEQVNTRFKKSYDMNVYTDNAILGANYLAWLIKYYGDAYFDGNHTLDAADCASTADMCQLNMVISAYNYGPGAVDAAADTNRPLPNPGYVQNVRRLMTECECLNL